MPTTLRFFLKWLGYSYLIFFLFGLSPNVSAGNADEEPIAFIGHGTLFDASGRPIELNLKLIEEAQLWYRSRLIQQLKNDDRVTYERMESQLIKDLPPSKQDILVVRAYLLNWMAARSVLPNLDRSIGKLKLLNSKLKYTLPDDNRISDTARKPFNLKSKIIKRLNDLELNVESSKKLFFSTTARSEEYRNLCEAHGVPLPKDFGPRSEWKNEGTIDKKDLFIAPDLDADVLVMRSESPKGICIALPRYNEKNEVQLDGIICLGQSDPSGGNRAKACFWDNQDPTKVANDATFTFKMGSPQSINRWAGGMDLQGGVGGVCTDCHAGENPFIIHGKVLQKLATDDLLSSSPLMVANTWYEPIIRVDEENFKWLQNPAPMQNVPEICSRCHDQNANDGKGKIGRLPEISEETSGYCNSVLRATLGARIPPKNSEGNELQAKHAPASMPPSSPGLFACTPGIPSDDPRYIKCIPGYHTTDCTNALTPDNSEFFKVKCTAEIAALLARCDPIEN